MIQKIAIALASGAAMFYLGRKSSQKDPFYDQSIEGITRKIKMNDYCNIIYSTLHKAPLVVHETLDKKVVTGDAERSSFFRDPTIKPQKFTIAPEDFTYFEAHKKHHFDRGHMAGASNYSSSQQLKHTTFTMANVVAQNSNNNGGIWNTFERYSRSLLFRDICQKIQLFSGPIFYGNAEGQEDSKLVRYSHRAFGENGTIVPTQLYKIIKCTTKDGKSYGNGFRFENKKMEDVNKRLDSYKVDIKQIENQTGLVFNLKDLSQRQLIDLDSEYFQKTRKDVDTPFYTNLFEEAKSVLKMNSAWQRGFRNQIYIKRQEYFDKVDQLAAKDLEQFKNSKKQNPCQALLDYLDFSEAFYYLKNKEASLAPYKDQIYEGIREQIIPCSQEDYKNNKQKGYVMYRAKRTKGYIFPCSEQIKQAFGYNQ